MIEMSSRPKEYVLLGRCADPLVIPVYLLLLMVMFSGSSLCVRSMVLVFRSRGLIGFSTDWKSSMRGVWAAESHLGPP